MFRRSFSSGRGRKVLGDLLEKLKGSWLGPPEPFKGPHAIGYVALGSASVGTLGSLCYWGIWNRNRGKGSSALGRRRLWEPYVQERVKGTFSHFGASALITGATASGLFRSRKFLKALHAHPWFIFFSSFGLQVVTGIIVMNAEFKGNNYFNGKEALWFFHSIILGLTISPTFQIGGTLMMKAFFITGTVIAFLSALAYCAPEDAFLRFGLPLGLGLAIIFGSSVGAFLFPHTTKLGISLFAIYLYGGLLLFSMMILRDVQRSIRAAELTEEHVPFDPVNAAMSLYMDALNIFVRIVQLLAFHTFSGRK